jgi:sigma-B regulation protein RsbU (phosphoserine phosphatase)
VNDELSQNNKSCMFVTIFAGILNIRSGELVYTNGGHNPPYIRRNDGALQRLDKRHGPAIGAMEGMVYKEERDRLEPGDLLFLYTDGVTEAMDVDHHLFSDDRLQDLLASLETDDADTAVDQTVSAVRAFEGEAEQADDITVLGLRYQGKPEDALMAEQRITIKSRMPEIAAVNEKFEAFAEEFGIPATVAMKFNVIFDELLNNIVTYAYRDDDEHDIEVRMKLVGKRLTVTITDDGVPFNPLSEEAPDIAAPLEEREIGGLGIHLVRNLIDDVTYQRQIGKNVMTLTRHLE